MWYHILAVIFLLQNFDKSSSLQEDYYWREYTGTIPEDAVIGGRDINGKEVYIGQAYVKNQGLIVAQIFPGIREVQVPIYGAKKVDSYIKILCGAQQNFHWENANSTNLHISLIDKHAVIGGHEDGGGILNIGRVSHEGDIKIGKVTSFSIGNALFYFTNKDKEVHVNSYEVLLFKNSEIDVRVKS